MMELLLLTSLRIGGRNVRYKLYFDPGQGRYFFKPEEITLRYPSFFLWMRQDDWLFEPLTDPGLQAQALEAMKELPPDKTRP